MLKLFIFALACGLFSLAQASTDQALIDLAERALEHGLKKDDDIGRDILQELAPKAHDEVVSEIMEEAHKHGLNSDEYIDAPESSETFLGDLRKEVRKKNLSKAEKLILLMKTGIRLKIQAEVRFEVKGLHANLAQVREISKVLGAEFGVTF